MINSISPINNVTMSSSSALAQYGQAQNAAKQIAQVVFSSLSKLTGSDESGISAESLEKLKTAIEEQNLTQKSAYKLVSTMIDKFAALSTDGKTISQDDFMTTINFSVAQGFSQSTNLYNILKPGGGNYSGEIVAKFGAENLQTLELMQMMDSLDEDTINKMIANLNSKTDDNEEAEPSVAEMIKLKMPINIKV